MTRRTNDEVKAEEREKSFRRWGRAEALVRKIQSEGAEMGQALKHKQEELLSAVQAADRAWNDLQRWGGLPPEEDAS